jgi:hypothetical protein
MTRTLTPLLVVVLLAAAVSVALAQPERAPAEERPLRLTEDEAAVLRQAQDLQKELEIARLELALAEAKELPEGEIADRAEQMYRLQGRLYALHAKNPELIDKVRRHDRQRRLGDREGMGRGRGRGMGRGRGHGPRGMRGGGRDAWGMGPGMGPGRGHRGHGMGPGMGQGRGRGHRGQDISPGMGPGHRARGMGPGIGQGRGGPGMGRGHGRQFGRGFGTRDPARLHLAPGFFPTDLEIEIVPESEG